MGRTIVIVGGVAGGAGVAARLRRLDEEAAIIMLERGPDISYANCGLPYHVGGEIPCLDDLMVMTPEALHALFAIEVRTNSEVTAVNSDRHELTVRCAAAEYVLPYDVLVLSPGAAPLRPALPGIDNPRCLTLRTPTDARQMVAALSQGHAGKVVIAGGGFIGVELTENLLRRGIEVTLVEAAPQILAPLDADFAALAAAQLRENGARIMTSCALAAVADDAEGVRVTLADGQALTADFVVLALGVRPDTAFLRDSGIALGPRGHIVVDAGLKTSAPDVYALGDAITPADRIVGGLRALPLAGPANRQARLVADAIAGKSRTYPGVVGSSVLRICELTAAATGHNRLALERQGLTLGRDFALSITRPSDHATYYPGSRPFFLKLYFRLSDGRLLGAQAVGPAGVEKRIDVIAALISHGGTVSELMDAELCYAPPFSSAKDPVNLAAYVADDILTGLTHPLYPEDLAPALAAGAQLIDVRPQAMFNAGHIRGARNIPAAVLRARMGELDRGRPVIICCHVGKSGYFMERFLAQQGFTVANVAGGFEYISRCHPEVEVERA